MISQWSLRRVVVLGCLSLVVSAAGCGAPSVPSLAQAAEEADAKEKPAAGKPSKKPPAAAKAEEEVNHPFERRSPAPELEGGLEWINTRGPLKLEDLKGKFVLLDFWTYCCINCMHILPELKKLEQAYPNELVVIGVHSAKFETEEDGDNIREAVMRYEIEHPVVNDAQHVLWNKFGVNSWPSLRVIDPEGNLVAGDSGEVTFEVLDGFLKKALPYYRQQNLLDETPVHFDLAMHAVEPTPLRFPGKVMADAASGRLFIADSNHNRIVVTDLEGKLQTIIGGGRIGLEDGDFQKASFNKPQGMAIQGQTLYVADTENHALRKCDLEAQTVVTIAGNGHQSHFPWLGLTPGVDELPERFVAPPQGTELNSPWDLWIHEDVLYIAMAGPHQIWAMPLDESEIGLYAGNGREDIVDGRLLPKRPYEQRGVSSFAQPSGLSSDGTWLYVADSEGSSIRAVPFDRSADVETVVGTAHLPQGRLFRFGDVDGAGREVRLQHALGVAWHDGQLYVADTYNNKIKVIDPEKKTCRTIAGTGKPGLSDDPPQFDEPAGIAVADDKLFIADTNNHRIRIVDLKQEYAVRTLEIPTLAPPAPPESPAAQDPGQIVKVDAQAVKTVDGKVSLHAALTLPQGYKVNPIAPMSYRVKPAGEGPVDGSSFAKPVKLKPPVDAFEIVLPVTGSGKQTVDVTLSYYYCKEGPGGLCRTGRVTWSIPLEIGESGAEQVKLAYVVE